ncbi:hypothetical protein [Myroides odoratus]|uniref:hypothetical protein n=1 Tax=Myroides odoratus TaxID=256 RepID=UPI0039AFDF07
MIGGGGLSDGISSTIAGGYFGKGMQQRLIVSGLNHSMHMVLDKIKENNLVHQALDREKLNPRILVG